MDKDRWLKIVWNYKFKGKNKRDISQYRQEDAYHEDVQCEDNI